MTDQSQSEERRVLAETLARARSKRDELRRELEGVERTIAELERKLVPQTGATTATLPRAASAWDRAVEATRRTGAVGRSPVRADQHSPRPSASGAAQAQSESPRGVAQAPVERAIVSPVVQAEPAVSPAAKETSGPEAARRRPAADLDGPCFMHAVESDERLAPHQREALRGVYERFVADWRERKELGGARPAEQALDHDPALARGQREALRTMLDRFLKKTTR